ncbi:hypothetical protein FHS18_000026 [Paenibacillus phyllosphaerae]|uniref:Uncharacterized protein n=1 Tax=Paenibacillus phyllosphaerae TaxID=274593 RepID=A0A7W5FKF3_9BACL|nr:hypothetical protein [Paenibacillus phyllosphaerae]MBB3107998.1 hypothetical protein [Paenibacillus phyllosphaerae]
MEVMFLIMGLNAALIVVLGILVKGALDMETIDKTYPTGQTLNGGVK